MSTPSQDDKHFRRGVVLGLTMAEILLLLTFLLMLLLTSALTRQKEQFRSITAERDAAVAELVELAPVVDMFESANLAKIDITKEYARVKAQLDAAEKKLADVSIGMDLVDEAIRQNPDAQDPKSAAEKFREAATLGASIKEVGGTSEALLNSAASCHKELQSCQGQTAYLNRRLNEQVGGFGLPPCWADKVGRIQYIFDAGLSDEGIILTNNKVPGREQEQAELPINEVKFDLAREPDQFGVSVAPLLRWSDAHQCRFYVRLIDKLAMGGRERYKTLRRSVEGYFYILDAK